MIAWCGRILFYFLETLRCEGDLKLTVGQPLYVPLNAEEMGTDYSGSESDSDFQTDCIQSIDDVDKVALIPLFVFHHFSLLYQWLTTPAMETNEGGGGMEMSWENLRGRIDARALSMVRRGHKLSPPQIGGHNQSCF
jgi:hypothetical protein